MDDSFASSRRYQIAFALLLAVCVAQVGWWMLDQWMFSGEVRETLLDTHRRSVEAATRMLESGVAVDDVAAVFPDLAIEDDGTTIRLRDDVLAVLDDERSSRLNRYAWEGAFFLVVLSAAIGVLWRALRTEARLRRRQHNFVTAVTHELKSPLAGVRLAAETLQYREADQPTRERLIARLLASLDRIEGTVANVLDTARIDESRVRLVGETVELAACINATVEPLRMTAGGAGVSLEISVPEDLVMVADRDALATVVRNLVSNAIAAATGTEGAMVTVSAAGLDGSVVVEVRDNGRGFAAEDAEKLFERFYRPGDEMRRVGRGTGLGLYIARALVVEGGGRLSGNSDGPGRGAVFRATWPSAGPDGRPTQ